MILARVIRIMRKFFNSFLWTSIVLLSLGLKAEVIKLPIYLDGASPDEANRRGEFYVYDVKGKLKPTVIVPQRFERPATIEQLIASVIYSYQQGDVKLFKSLFDSQTQKKLNEIDEKTFSERFTSFKTISECKLLSYFFHNGGHVAQWKETKDKGKSDLVFIKEESKVFKFSGFSAKKEDFRFTNISYFLTFPEFKYQKAALIDSIDPGKKDLSLTIKNTYEYVTFFKKIDNRWLKRTVLKDNISGKYQFNDLDPNIGSVKIEFQEQNFTPNTEHDILVVESTFPIAYLPLNFSSSGQIKVKAP